MHRSIRATLAIAVLAASTMPAFAGRHHICYEGKPRLANNGQIIQSAVFGCSDDAAPGGACTFTLPSGGTPTLENWPFPNRSLIRATGDFAVFESVAGGQSELSAVITFPDNTRTQCTVRPKSRAVSGAIYLDASTRSVLTGFMTDDSGQVSTGIWRATSTSASVPAGFVLTAGGVEAAAGSFISQASWGGTSPSSPGSERFNTYTVDDNQRTPAETTTYAIGLKINGLEADALAKLVTREWVQSTTDYVPAVAATRVLAVDQVAFGGDFRAGLLTHTASVTAPVMARQWLNCVLVLQPCTPPTAVGWRGEATGPGANKSTFIYVTARFLPKSITLDDGSRWELRSRVVSGAPVHGQAQAAQAGGLRGTHALTAVGAVVDWRPFATVTPPVGGNRIVSLVPDAELGGARVASGFTSTSDAATLTAWGLGLRLVPEGTPPEVDEPPKPEVPFDVSLLCSSIPEMDGKTELCRYRGKSMPLGSICPGFGKELKPFGLCVPPKP